MEFVQPIEIELTGHKSLSSNLLASLTVSVDGHALQYRQNRFYGEIPFTVEAQSKWNVSIEHNREKLFDGRWDQTSSNSNSIAKIELEGEVSFDLPSGFVLHKVNGKSNFEPHEREVKVPFGEKLDVVIADLTGVIKFRENVKWEKEINFVGDEYLRSKRLRNQGNQATYWLVRKTGDPSVRKEIGQTNEVGSLPTKNLGDYVVIVEWSSTLKREIELEKFLRSEKSVELWLAAKSQAVR